jgi:DNA repair exonuclease SbcCD ATPase subunit
MMYLIAQTWLFLAISCLIGMLMMYFLVRNQKSERQTQLEAEALDARHRAITVEKEIEEYRARLAELEGLPASARASRIAAREEMAARISQLERDLSSTQTSEKKLAEESGRLRAEVDTFRTRYLEARAKWDEYKAKADALAAAPQPLNLGAAQIVPDETMRKRVLELEAALAETAREKDRIGEQARSFMARTRELERQVANGAPAPDTKSAEAMKAMQVRASELEGQLAQTFRERDGASQQIQQMLSRIRELESALATASQSGERTQESSRTVQSRVTDLEASLVIATREREIAVQQISQLTSRLVDAERLSATVGQQSEKSSDAARQMQARIAELEARLAAGFASARESDAMKSRVLDLQDKLSEAEVALSKSLNRLKQETDPLKVRISELETRLAHAAATNTQGDTIAVLQSADNVELRAKLADAEARAAKADVLASEVEQLTQRLSQAPTAAPTMVTPSVDPEEARVLRARVTELELDLEHAQRQASEAQSLKSQITNLETRLNAALQIARMPEPSEDVSLLKARLADVEARLMAQNQSSAEVNNLHNRVAALEAMLHEAAKSRDEAAVLRAKVAELDGRLGLAMKAAAEARARNPQNEAV